jgi:inosine triphosphate pyrophosphatase
MKKEIVYVTGNKNKLLEVQKILSNEFKVIHHKLDTPEFQGLN